MSDTSNIWVRSSTLEEAITGKTTQAKKRGLPTDAKGKEEFIDWGWAFATLVARSEGSIQVNVQDDNSPHNLKTVELPANSFEKGDIEMGNKYGEFGGGEDENSYPDDLIVLTHLHQAEVVHCLRKRYTFDKIYTATGAILLALNPFKYYKDLYSKEKMEKYWHRGEQEMKGIVDDEDPLPPHVFGTADHSFRKMMMSFDDNGGSDSKFSDQSILVSGESGAGKTVTTKFILQYLATLSQRSGTASEGSKVGESGPSVEQQVLQSNPILESFGNARTVRNDNSSRFGKYIEIKFTKTGSLAGASIATYLLEKVRLVTQTEGERNYHIFYELFAMEDGELEKFHMGIYNPEDFKITNQSGTYDRRDGVEDFETFGDLKKAMEIQGWSESDKHDIMTIPAAALHASNVVFRAISNDECALDTDCAHLEPFLQLMGIDKDALEKALCFLKIKAGREFHMRTLSREKAAKAMEAFIKAFYGALFNFLVQRVNSSITVKEDAAGGGNGKKGGKHASIGVLDIFGFESFKHNSFEQLCINYCNEALQQQFNRFVLKNEQSEYEREGIDWSFISFPDNEEVLQLIDKKGSGILNILDDMCRAPGTSDKSFCQALYKNCMSHPRFEANSRLQGANKFAVNHYAGPVEYSSNGFVEKNRDDLPKEASDLLLASTSGIVKELGKIISSPSAESTKKSSSGRKGKGGGKMTVGIQFSRQLKELRDKIDVTSPHYVRCLKPNDLLVPDYYNPLIISEQLRYAGVIEAVRVSRVGYPHRYTHNAFVSRYRLLAQVELKKSESASSQKPPVQIVVDAVAKNVWKEMQCGKEGKNENEIGEPDFAKMGFQVGKTKVFLRRPPYEILEQLRGKKNTESAALIQKNARRYIEQRKYKNLLQKTLKVQCVIRSLKAKNIVHEKRRNYRSSIIQKYWRRTYQLKRFTSIIIFARWLQKYQRGKQGRRLYEKLNQNRKAIVIQKYWRCFSAHEYFVKASAATLRLQCALRCFAARKHLIQLKKKARDLGSAVAERDSLRKEAQQLRAELEAVKAAAASAEANATSSISIEELENAQSYAKQMDEEIKQLKSVLEESNTEKEEYQKRMLAAEETVKASEAKVEEYSALTEKYKNECISEQEKMKNLSANLKEKEKEVFDLMERLSALQLSEEKGEEEKKEMESREQELISIQNELDLARQKIVEISDTLEQVTAERDELSEQVNSSISSNKIMEEEMQPAKQKNVGISENPEHMTEERNILPKQLDSVNISNSTLHEALDLAEQKFLETKKTLEHVSKERDNLLLRVELSTSSDKEILEEIVKEKQRTKEIAEKLDEVEKERNELVDKLKSPISSKEEVNLTSKQDILSHKEVASNELDSAKKTILMLQERLRKATKNNPPEYIENSGKITEERSNEIAHEKNSCDVVSYAEYNAAMSTIRELKKQLQGSYVSQENAETVEPSESLSKKINYTQKETLKTQDNTSFDLDKMDGEIESLKTKLKGPLDTTAQNGSTSNVQMTLEIKTLEDEVARLNRELVDSKKTNQSAGEIDRNSPALIRDRYEELRRLSDALMDKDKLIMKLTMKLEKLEDYTVQAGGFHNGTEAIALRTRVKELESQLNYYQHSHSSSFDKNFRSELQNSNSVSFGTPLRHEIHHYDTNFMPSTRQNHHTDPFPRSDLQNHAHQFHTVSRRPSLQSSRSNAIRSNNSSRRNLWSIMNSVFDDPTEDTGQQIQPDDIDLKRQLDLLKKENMNLRADSDKTRKKASALESELKTERATAKRELESFAKTLRGVDELRTAAETMSRQVNKYKKKPTWNNSLGQLVEDEIDRKSVQNNLRFLTKSQSHFEHQGHPSGFWKLLDAVAISKPKNEDNTEEEPQGTLDSDTDDIQKIKAVKRRRKKNSFNKSTASSFM